MRVSPILFLIGFVCVWITWRRGVLLRHPTLTPAAAETTTAPLATALAALASTAAPAAALAAATGSHTFADRALAERSGSITHWCHNSVLSFNFVFRG